MDTKKFVHVAGGIFLLCASAIFLWQMTGPSWFKNIKAEVTSQPYARTITVDGEGKVTSKPDIATITFSVISEGTTVKDVTADGNTRMGAVVEAVKKLGVDPKDIMTSSYYLNPVYPQVIYEPTLRAPVVPKISGYSLNQSATAKIRNLDSVDDVLDAAVKAGANDVGGLSFDIDEDSALKKDARGKAFTAAREKAEEMAGAAGVKLGRVVTFSEATGGYPQPFYREMAFDTKAEAGAMPAIEPGSKELTVNVSVTYEIE